MHIYGDMVKYSMVDAIVATGASIVDMDFFEALGLKHYQAAEIPDDDTLRALYIDRIYDTYIDEEELQNCDHTIYEIADSLEPRPYSSREFIQRDGQVAGRGQRQEARQPRRARLRARRADLLPGVHRLARPASAWSSTRSSDEARRPYLTIDAIADFRELTDIKIAAGTTGLLMVGGGVPKNFAQDTVVCAEILGHEDVECTSTPCRSPSPTCATAPARPRRCRRPRAGARSDRHRADGVRRGHLGGAADRSRRLPPRRLEDPRQAPLGQAVRLSRLPTETN